MGNMTEEAQRIAIAEARGWDFDPIEARGWQSRGKWAKGPDGKLVFNHSCPDYLNDLNAMHEAEKVLLDREIGSRFRLELCKNSDGPNSMFMTVEAAMCHATAAQRAEAFLRTLNLWDDSK